MQKRVSYYWLDVAEPGYSVYDFDNYRYYLGTVNEVGNIYPNEFLKMIYENSNDKNSVVTLVRGAWAGAQKYGALVWSGDIDSSFRAFRNQINTGLNVSIAGIPWWTTDIGGFHGGNPNDKKFRELIIRWFQYSTFSPILRMHGDRLPHSKSLSNSGGGLMPTGAGNEIWSYGEEVELILTKYIRIREILKEYLNNLMLEAHLHGYPILRPLFYEFELDSQSWEVENQYMLGEDILVSPVTNYLKRENEVYLPTDDIWIDVFSMKKYKGGKKYIVEAPIYKIPIFIKEKNIHKYTELVKYISKNF